MIVILRATFLLVVLAVLAACGGSDSGDDDQLVDAGEPSPLGTVTAETAVDAVESFDPAGEDPVARLDQVILAGGDFVPDLAPILEDEDTEPNSRWAALYVIALLTDTDEEIAVLEPMLEDDDEIFRVMAAGSLAGLGVTESLPVLIEGLSSESELPFSHPPRPLRAYARATLEHYTGESFEDAADWEDWWDEVSSDISWDGEGYVAS
jgi:HEAT repeat protein